jgi:adenylyltransferase/sulfurtransferase
MSGFSNEQALRYARQISIPQIGAAGQERLLGSRAVVIGAGGLGCAALLYMAAAGVGHIRVVDADPVELTNLNRQIAHGASDLGRNKAASARESMLRIDPALDVTTVEERIVAANAPDILVGHDVVLDCTDNFPTRYLLNDACVILDRTLVTAAVLRLFGQVMTIEPHRGPCLRCMLPEPPEPGSVPDCSQAGVLGPVAGAMGCLQAVEAIKVLLHLPDTLTGRVFALDTLAFEPSVMRADRDPACPVCGQHPTITTLSDLRPSC